jgi:purine-binding chemotaxis protein CheW
LIEARGSISGELQHTVPHAGGEVAVLVLRVGPTLCALPVSHVGETLRPLPIQPLPDSPAFVRGLAVVRGEPTPVIDLAELLGVAAGACTRFVTVAVDGRRTALAVDAVTGVRKLPARALGGLPPLLREAERVEAVGRLDAELLLVLRAARLVGEEEWARIDCATTLA